MQTRSITSELYLDSVDEYLGPAESRFFGSGYRRVRYVVRDLAMDHHSAQHESGGSVPLRATVGVVYPTDWSSKSAHVELRPHLSTVDALILGVRLSETCLEHATDMDDRLRRTAWLRRVDIKAGSEPNEEGLDAVAVEAVLRETTAAPDTMGGHISVVDCRIGNMTVRCEVEHGVGPASSGRGTAAGSVSSAPLRRYGDGYQHQSQLVEKVRIDPASQHAEALVTVDPAPGQGLLGDGLEAQYHPSVSMVDSFVVSLQLGQVLLYELDRFPRAESNTLWMRHTSITRDTPHRSAADPFEATASLVDARLLRTAGGIWRTATIVGDCQGVRTRCAVTHQLPITAQSGDA